MKGFTPQNPVPNFNEVIDRELAAIRQQYAGYVRKDASLTEPLCHYISYYKRYKKTYPVMHQLESVLLKGKSIPPVEPLVQAMFLAELKHLLLTAGHDLDSLQGDVTICAATGGEQYAGITGREVSVSPKDICMRDAVGTVSAIVYGPDARTRITEETKNAFFLVKGIKGITEGRILAELRDLLIYLQVFCPKLQAAHLAVHTPSEGEIGL